MDFVHACRRHRLAPSTWAGLGVLEILEILGGLGGGAKFSGALVAVAGWRGLGVPVRRPEGRRHLKVGTLNTCGRDWGSQQQKHTKTTKCSRQPSEGRGRHS